MSEPRDSTRVKGAHGATTTRATVSIAVPLVLTLLLLGAALLAAFAEANKAVS